MYKSNHNVKLVRASLEPKEKNKSGINANESDFREDTGAPVDIITFHRDYLGRNLGEAQIEAYQAVWGKDGNQWDRTYHEIVLLIGMKGGKNFWSEGDVAYACYFISSLRDPHAFFSKLAGKPELYNYNKDKTFDFVNVSSVNENQARRSFFESVKKILQSTKDPVSGQNWFEKYAGLDLREHFGDFTKNEIVFPTGQPGTGGIRLLSFNSTATAPEGLHILRYYIDEMSRAETKAAYKEAEALLNLGLHNTLASFPNGVGKTIAWSYPNDTDYDLTFERYELSKTQSQIFGRKYATWEFNPSLTKENFEIKYKSDPRTARRIYECIKGVSNQNFFQPHTTKLDQMLNSSLKNRVVYRPITVSRYTNAGEQTFTGAEIISIKGDNETRFLAFDASLSNDRFVILGGRLETRELLNLDFFVGDTQEIISTNVKLIIDIMIVLEPTKDSPIDYIGIGDIFSKLIAAFPNIHSINSDHFQNQKLRQEFIVRGISSKTYNFSNSIQLKLYSHLRANVFTNNIEICIDSHQLNIGGKLRTISEALIWEAKSVLREGSKIDHPNGGSKDIIDALAILCTDMIQAEVLNLNTPFDFDSTDNIKLDLLCKKFMRIELELEAEGYFRSQILPEIARRMGIPYEKIIPLAEYIQDEFSGYTFTGKNTYCATIRFNDDIAKVRGYDDTTTYFPEYMW